MGRSLSDHCDVRLGCFCIFTLAALAVSGTASAQPTPTVAPWDHLGQLQTVCGVVVALDCFRHDGTLWFDLNSPRRDVGISVAIDRGDRAALGPRLGHFLLQPVCGTGRLEKEGKRILVRSTPGGLVLNGARGELPSGLTGDVYTACDEGVSLPTLVREVKPSYTREAMRAIKQGNVLVAAVVLPDGRVGDVVVTVSLDKTDGLDAEAVATVKRWLFRPGTLDGRPVPVIVSVELTFKLK